MEMIAPEYIESLPEIYKEILRAYVMFTPQNRVGEGVAFQSLYVGLSEHYTLAEIRVACEKMADAGVLEIRNEIFVYPTQSGSTLIAAITKGKSAEVTVPDFPPIPSPANMS
jgi:hypothetical protein